MSLTGKTGMSFTKELYDELKQHYNLAVEEEREQFVFHHAILLTSYAKYLVEFLKDKYESIDESTQSGAL
jgi:hypothetical protein